MVGMARTMKTWSDTPQTRLVERLKPVPAPLRAHLREGPFTFSRHDAAFDQLPALREIEKAGPAPKREGLSGAAKLIFWNVERLRHLDAIANHLQDQAADVILLSEVDRGMARTGNSDRIAMLSDRLGLGYLYAVEFVELGLGDVHEQRRHAGEVNAEGFHGAAILSDVALHAPALIRIERRGNWYGLDRHEPRIGSTIALLAWVKIDGERVLMANVHLESHETPASRGEDMLNLLAMIETLAPKGRVILGGDFNTSTGSHGERHGDPATLLVGPRVWQPNPCVSCAPNPTSRFSPLRPHWGMNGKAATCPISRPPAIRRAQSALRLGLIGCLPATLRSATSPCCLPCSPMAPLPATMRVWW